jgi:hypothetical protein
MRKIILMALCGLVISFTSCSKKQASFSEDVVEEVDAHHLSVNRDSTFSGEVWDDSHRICVTTVNGQKRSIVVTHPNGKKAAERKWSANGADEGTTFFDEDGKEITPMEFGSRYKSIVMEFGESL